jgi:glycine betaine/proline transport system permease protein
VSASIKVELSLRAIIAALAGGLGEPVVTGLGQLDVGATFVGQIGIVIIAIMLDRVYRALKK